jgi:hypothetical protein
MVEEIRCKCTFWELSLIAPGALLAMMRREKAKAEGALLHDDCDHDSTFAAERDMLRSLFLGVCFCFANSCPGRAIEAGSCQVEALLTTPGSSRPVR